MWPVTKMIHRLAFENGGLKDGDFSVEDKELWKSPKKFKVAEL